MTGLFQRAGRWTNRHWPWVLVALVLVLVLVQWLPYQPRSNFNGETGFALASLGASGWRAFIYWGDPTRMFTQVPYHLGHLLNSILGIPGSALGYQLVYLALWVVRGVLIGVIAIKAFRLPAYAGLAAAAIASTFGADDATNWIGQLNQHWFLALAISAAALTLVPFQRRGSQIAAAAGVGITAFLALWSYEAVLPVLLTTVLISALLMWNRRSTDSWLPTAVLAGVSIASLIANAERYLTSNGATYQEAVGRKVWVLGDVAHDLAWHLRNAFAVWAWGPDGQIASMETWMRGLAAIGSLLAVGIVLLSLFAYRTIDHDDLSGQTGRAWLLTAWGALVILGGAAPYMALQAAWSPWRTQFTAGVGVALLVGGLAAALLPTRLRPRRVAARGGGLVLVIIVGMSAYFGIQAALLDGQRFQHLWAAQAKEMQSLLRVAPCLRPDTVVMLQIAPGADPFGHQMWFNHALQLAYWHTPGVSGVYALSDGALGPGADQVTSWTNPANHARRPVLVLVERPDGSVQRREVPPISLVRAVGVDLNAALPIPQPCPARSSFGPQMVGAG